MNSALSCQCKESQIDYAFNNNIVVTVICNFNKETSLRSIGGWTQHLLNSPSYGQTVSTQMLCYHCARHNTTVSDNKEIRCVNKFEFYIKTKPRDKDPFDDTASNSSSQDSNTLCLSLLECLEVEFELLSFEDISVTSATLARARRNAS